MISTKQFLNVNGITKRFLVDFPIASDQHARVYVHSIGQPTINDLVSLNKFDMIDNSIVFFTAPVAGSIVTIEVATDTLEFGNTIALPAATIATNAAIAAEGYALSALSYKNQAGVYAGQALGYSNSAHTYATAADASRALCVLAANDAALYAGQAYTYKVAAELAYTNTAALETSFTATATGAIAIANGAVATANGANTKSNTAIATANAATATANTAINTAVTASTNANTALTNSNTAVTTANSAVTTANTASTDASAALTVANTANTNASTALTTANSALTLANSSIKSTAVDTDPATGLRVGDLNFKPASGYAPYRYDGVSWVLIRDGNIAIAQTTASNAQTTATNAQTTATNAYNLAAANISMFRGYDQAVMTSGYLSLDNTQPPYVPRLKYATGSQWKNISSNYSYGTFYLTSSDFVNTQLQLSETTAGFQIFGGSTGSFYGIRMDYPTGLYPIFAGSTPLDNLMNLGQPSARWSNIYAGNGTIITSDGRTKEQIFSLTNAEKAVALKLKNAIKTFKFKEAVIAKGDGARIHVGVIAQEVKAIFESEGLIAEKYAILCYDTWDAIPETLEEIDAEGVVIKPHCKAVSAGNRYGIRYEELLAFIISAI